MRRQLWLVCCAHKTSHICITRLNCCWYNFANIRLIFSFFFEMQTKMGMGGDVNGCGLCAKYSLFIANFVMFVSKNGIANNSPSTIFICFFFFQFSDWWSCSIRVGHMDISWSQFYEGIARHESLLRHRLCAHRNRCDRMLGFVFWLLRRCQGSEMSHLICKSQTVNYPFGWRK